MSFFQDLKGFIFGSGKVYVKFNGVHNSTGEEVSGTWWGEYVGSLDTFNREAMISKAKTVAELEHNVTITEIIKVQTEPN